jgi:hypothetical protein
MTDGICKMLILLYFTNIPTLTTLLGRIKREKVFFFNNGDNVPKEKIKKIILYYRLGMLMGW